MTTPATAQTPPPELGGTTPGTNTQTTNALATNAQATNAPATNAPATNVPATNALGAIVARDVALAFRSGGGAAEAVVFYALVIVLFVLGIGPEPTVLARVAAPVLWTAALLASLLSLDRMFQADFEDGSLEMLVQRTPTLPLLVLAKALAHWLTTCAPLILATPVLGIVAGLAPDAVGPLMASLMVGTPALSLTGAIGAALTFPLRRASVLLTILIGPLFAPVVIFGVGAATADLSGPAGGGAPLLLLGAATLSTLLIAPLAGGAAIRFNMHS